MAKPFPPFEIGKPGRAVATSGAAMDFTPAILAELAETYDPAVHDAPFVVGHPTANTPAFGWAQALRWMPQAGRLFAVPRDVNPEFAEAVEARAYPKRSMSIYLPDSPTNPKPGKHYLRHIGFLGGQPPAIKGLSDIQFAEAEEGVLEFSEYDDTLVAQTLQNLREWLLTAFGQDVADKVIPVDTITYLLQSSAREAIREVYASGPSTSFSEPPPAGSQTENETPAAEFAEREQALNAKQAELDAKQVLLEARLKALKRKGIEDFAEGLVADGCRLLPRDKSGLVEFMAGLEEGVLEFSEADGGKQDRVEWLKGFLGRLPRQVDFSEFDPPGQGEPEKPSDAAIANQARDYKARLAESGTIISFSEAVDAVRDGKANPSST